MEMRNAWKNCEAILNAFILFYIFNGEIWTLETIITLVFRDYTSDY